jgi:hypothetical protein
MQTPASLPNIRVISTPVANVILLRSIGSRLRSHYDDPLHLPVPEQLNNVVKRMR